MNTTVEHSETPVTTMSALEALEKDQRWLTTGARELAVLKRIAMQRDRLAQARKAQDQAKALAPALSAVPADAPLPERVMVFAKLHPVATAAAAGLALMIGPRKLLRYGGLALPLIKRFKR